MPKRVARSRATIRAGADDKIRGQRRRRRARAACAPSPARPPAPRSTASSPDAAVRSPRARERGEEFRVAGMPKSRLVEHVLGDRVGDERRRPRPPRHEMRPRVRSIRSSLPRGADPAGPAYRIDAACERDDRQRLARTAPRRPAVVAVDDRDVPAEIARRGGAGWRGSARTANGGRAASSRAAARPSARVPGRCRPDRLASGGAALASRRHHWSRAPSSRRRRRRCSGCRYASPRVRSSRRNRSVWLRSFSPERHRDVAGRHDVVTVKVVHSSI